MVKQKIPAGPQDLTPEWLTQALRQSSVIGDAAVSSLETETIAEGVGLIGQLARVTPRYDRPEAGAPASLIGKFPAAAPENRELAGQLRFYEREFRFYEEIAEEVELRTPRRYFGAMDADSGEYVLLLEDLAPARVGDQLAGCSRREADLAVREREPIGARVQVDVLEARLDVLAHLHRALVEKCLAVIEKVDSDERWAGLVHDSRE